MEYEIWYKDEALEKFKDLANNPRSFYCFSERPEGMITVSPGAKSKLKPEDIEPPCTPAIPFARNGGTIITFPENIVFMIFDYKPNGHIFKAPFLGFKLKTAVIDYLKSKKIPAYLDGNDIMVLGYKVAGDSFRRFEFNKDIGMYAIEISINIDLDIIKKYCDKEMVKVPAGLSKWGITRAEIIDVIKNALPDKI